MTVLIMTEPDDIHAILVSLALQKKGFNCELFFSADMPSRQKNKILFQEGKTYWLTHTDAGQLIDWERKSINTVWWRRPRKPFIPEYVHQEDEKFVQRENMVYHNSLPWLIDQNAWWVNPIESTYKTQSKITQLKCAQSVGFKIPDTLISNSPKDIRKFLQDTKDGAVIYKPFTPNCWVESDGLRMLYTDKIKLQDLPSDEMLQLVPGIFQHYVNKKYEVRVTCFGHNISAVKIDSQAHALGQTDWRKIPGDELVLSPITLPDHIKTKIIRFMEKMDVVFGCFDFIVTEDDDIIFLELNEQGQFLWIEDRLPELRYMDMFAEFLICKTFYFKWSKTARSLSSFDFDGQARRIAEENMKNHVYLNQIKRIA